MKKANIIQEKTFDFALKIINLYKDLRYNWKEFVLSKQVLRSGTSIGANVEEAIGGFSKRDFGAKINIAYKESRETRYWLRLLYHSKYINEIEYKTLINDCDHIIKILTSIGLTLKKNNS